MAYDPTERETQVLNTGRAMRAQTDVMIPMLNRQREEAITKISQAYRAGDLAKLPVHAAQLVTVEDMLIEIKQKIAKAEHIERKIFEHGNAD